MRTYRDAWIWGTVLPDGRIRLDDGPIIVVHFADVKTPEGEPLPLTVGLRVRVKRLTVA